ncbi:hypothetical protein EZJ43_15145 [Pedobacter changchengzhani]|uniref:Uncharacterized protein n=1 Tax=Pedobacter changchengzhani TaxID=2529274 RepID=A0A4R5MHN4_9SPHI|nr:DUF6498-containing protein [Pedobacter changchengzhani]TDG35060.1 hypothetical protein EZJ43_15145 [Pedobacter changchengzhani]
MKATRLTNLISILIFTGYSLFIVLSGEANLFFIIYLYFLDEVIKNIFLTIKSIRLKALSQGMQAVNNALKTRFFMLFIYSVFIIFVFGLFYGLTNSTREEFIRNVMIFKFRDLYFNISISIIVVRECINLFIDFKNAKQDNNFQLEGMNNGMMVLHLSILFGAVIWFLTSGKFEYFHLSFGAYDRVAIIFPFLLIKFLFDLNSILRQRRANIISIDVKGKNG